MGATPTVAKRSPRHCAESGSEAIFVPVELGDLDRVAALVAAADARFGRVDILVNSGASTDRGTILDTTPELWDRIMDVNLRAPFFLIQAVARIMRREGIAGADRQHRLRRRPRERSDLGSVRHLQGALLPLTRNAAFALSRDRIRINTLNIGWMDTPAEDAIQREYHGAPDDWLAAAEAGMPFGRILKPDEVARRWPSWLLTTRA